MVVQPVVPEAMPGLFDCSSPLSAPQVREASPMLPPLSTLPSGPTARWPGNWPCARGTTTSSWFNSPVLSARNDTWPAGTLDGLTKIRCMPIVPIIPIWRHKPWIKVH
jgi:hypothetical protein